MDVEQLVLDIKRVRERGIARVRDNDVPTLVAAVEATGVSGVEELIVRALSHMDERVADGVRYALGVDVVGRSSADRRADFAAHFDRTAETVRRPGNLEDQVFGKLARAIQGLISEVAATAAATAVNSSTDGHYAFSRRVIVGGPREMGSEYIRRSFDDAIDAAWSDGAERRVWLRGVPGCGKTFTAGRIWGNAIADGRDGSDRLLVWVDSAGPQAVAHAFAEVARRVPEFTALLDLHENSGTDAIAEQVVSLLATAPWAWLVVLDNADASALIDARLIPTGRHPRGRVLLTTLDDDVRMPRHGRIVHAGIFTPEESEAFLRSLRVTSTRAFAFGANVPPSATTKLAAAVGRMPLMLSTAASTIAAHALSIDEWITDLQSRPRLDSDEDEPDAGGYTSGVARAWSLALDKAGEGEPPGVVHRTALVAALLDPDGHPTWLWDCESIIEWVSGGAPLSTRHGRPTAVMGLVGHRMLDLRKDWTGGLVSIHQLYARATRELFTQQDRAAIGGILVEAFVERLPLEDSPFPYHLRRNIEVLLENTVLHGRAAALRHALIALFASADATDTAREHEGAALGALERVAAHLPDEGRVALGAWHIHVAMRHLGSGRREATMASAQTAIEHLIAVLKVEAAPLDVRLDALTSLMRFNKVLSGHDHATSVVDDVRVLAREILVRAAEDGRPESKIALRDWPDLLDQLNDVDLSRRVSVAVADFETALLTLEPDMENRELHRDIADARTQHGDLWSAELALVMASAVTWRSLDFNDAMYFDRRIVRVQSLAGRRADAERTARWLLAARDALQSGEQPGWGAHHHRQLDDLGSLVRDKSDSMRLSQAQRQLTSLAQASGELARETFLASLERWDRGASADKHARLSDLMLLVACELAAGHRAAAQEHATWVGQMEAKHRYSPSITTQQDDLLLGSALVQLSDGKGRDAAALLDHFLTTQATWQSTDALTHEAKLAFAWGQRSRAASLQGDHAASVAALETAVRIQQAIVDLSPQDAELLRELAWFLTSLAHDYGELTSVGQQRDVAERATATARALSSMLTDPRSAAAPLALATFELGSACLAQDDPAAAISAYRECAVASERWRDLEDGDVTASMMLQSARVRLTIALGAGEAPATTAYATPLAESLLVFARDRTIEVALRNSVATELMGLGEVSLRLELPDWADHFASAAIDAIEALDDVDIESPPPALARVARPLLDLIQKLAPGKTRDRIIDRVVRKTRQIAADPGDLDGQLLLAATLSVASALCDDLETKADHLRGTTSILDLIVELGAAPPHLERHVVRASIQSWTQLADALDSVGRNAEALVARERAHAVALDYPESDAEGQ